MVVVAVIAMVPVVIVLLAVRGVVMFRSIVAMLLALLTGLSRETTKGEEAEYDGEGHEAFHFGTNSFRGRALGSRARFRLASTTLSGNWSQVLQPEGAGVGQEGRTLIERPFFHRFSSESLPHTGRLRLPVAHARATVPEGLSRDPVMGIQAIDEHVEPAGFGVDH